MSQNKRPELVAVQIRDEEHKEAWWQVEQLVAEAYTGGDSLGRWQE
jgi:hypothetical protein